MFMGKLMSQLCSLLGILTIKTSPYHPQTDGLLERWHHDLLVIFKKVSHEKKEWDLYLPFVLFVYRSTPHSITGFTHFNLYMALMFAVHWMLWLDGRGEVGL